jgi:hypothetical protein
VTAAATVTEAEVLRWLRRRYNAYHGNGPRWVYATDVPDTAGGLWQRRADAVAMDMWKSGGWELHGHEIKVTRSDWLRELREPGKADAMARFCDRWWLVVSDRSIVKNGELPDGWGLLVAGPQQVRAVVRAPRRQPDELPRSFVAALLRSAVRTAERAVTA